MPTISQMRPGDKFRTKDGRYFQEDLVYGLKDELGRHTTLVGQDTVEGELIPDWPKLRLGHSFTLASPYKLAARWPSSPLIFQLGCGFRFRTYMEDYRITIPFWFLSTDTRIGWLQHNWTARSGRILTTIADWPLHILYETVPVLHTLDGTSILGDSQHCGLASD